MNDTITAIWKAAWYELDQPIAVGLADNFHLTSDADGLLKFHTGFGTDKEYFEYYSEIESIHHSVLGPIMKIDCSGLSYRVYTVAGDVIQIEAEERPGYIEHSTIASLTNLNDFSFTVKLNKLKNSA